MTLTIGALFAGYGGLDLAVMDVLDAELAWYAEFDKAPASIMAHHHPDVPNLWDVTKVQWDAVEPVDVITGGSPCQDLSHAGKRKGMTDGTRSNLWAEMREAIAVHRPRLVVWENVRGAYSAAADSDLESCPGCVGGAGDGKPVLRALGRVLGDLAELGYDARWYGLRAADVGAAHGRFRVFVIAAPAADPGSIRWREGSGDGSGPGPETGGGEAGRVGGHRLLGAHSADLTLLPTPAVNDMGANYTPEQWDAWTDRMKAAHGNGNGHGKSLAIEAQRMAGDVPLFPTPTTSDTNGPGAHGDGGADLRTAVSLLPTPRTQNNENRQSEGYGGERGNYHGLVNGTVSWGDYGPAIARWETVIGRPSPDPTEPGRNGAPRLSPRFVEWLMGLPAGHVTDVPGITRNHALKALGNGVVPQQAAAALRAYLADERAWREAVAS